MDRSLRNHKISIEHIRRILMISRKISLVEYPYAIMKGLFHFSHVMVTLARRIRVKFNVCTLFIPCTYFEDPAGIAVAIKINIKHKGNLQKYNWKMLLLLIL